MGRPTRAQQLQRAARAGEPVHRVEIPRVVCTRCGQHGIYALSDGSPRPYVARPTRPHVGTNGSGGGSWIDLAGQVSTWGAAWSVPGPHGHAGRCGHMRAEPQ